MGISNRLRGQVSPPVVCNQAAACVPEVAHAALFSFADSSPPDQENDPPAIRAEQQVNC
jgi:hypothetical protein